MRLIAGLVACVTVTACTPEEIQVAYWLNRDPPTVVPCREWVGSTRAAGFDDDQIAVVHRLMQRESGCDPNAHNPSGASGLMQVMPMWADDCGGLPGDLFDPNFNLRCAHHVYETQGWHAWSTYP